MDSTESNTNITERPQVEAANHLDPSVTDRSKDSTWSSPITVDVYSTPFPNGIGSSTHVETYQPTDGTDQTASPLMAGGSTPVRRSTEEEVDEFPDVPVIVVPGDPILTSSPQRPVRPLDMEESDSMVTYTQKKRDEAIKSFLHTLNKAKSGIDIQFLIDKNRHMERELDAKHAAEGAHKAMTDDRGGAISGLIPIEHSQNQRKLDKVNEQHTSPKKKPKY